MKRGILFVSIAGALIGAFALGRAGAQEGPKAGADKAKAEMEAFMKLAKPGAQHAELMKNVGTWNVECQHWMMPGAPPVVDKGRAVFTSVLGGRFLRQEYEGTFMGQPFQGIGCTGFNNATKEYEDVWTGTNMTGIMYMTGTETEPGKVWTFSGSCAGPDGNEMTMRSVWTKVSDTEQKMEMYCASDEGEMKCMELKYTRAK
jgi:hypothetical protein